MTIFAVIALGDARALGEAVSTQFRADHLVIAPGIWLVAGTAMTAKDVSDKLGITEGTGGSGIVITFAGYFGRASTNIWEWIAAKSKAGSSG